MSLTYATLQTTVMDYLDRDDLSTVVPTFIELAEAKFKRKLRHWKMEQRATADTVASQRTLDLPSNFLEMRSLKRNSDPTVVLEHITPAIADAYVSGTGAPLWFHISGQEIHFEPTPDGVYQIEMNYYEFDPLSGTTTTNWLLEDHPDIYLYGTLLEAEAYLMNDPRLQIWKMAFDQALLDLNKEARVTRMAGAPLTVRYT